MSELEGGKSRLRVLIADETTERLVVLASIVRDLGHDTIAAETAVGDVGAVTAREHPDVALVALGESSEHALALISKIAGESECPVIAVLQAADVAFITEAARRGVFAYVIESDQDALASALEIVLLRFADYHSLESAFARRALIEPAKGVLMERHGIEEAAAFELLRGHARRNNQTIVDISHAVIQGHLLLPPR